MKLLELLKVIDKDLYVEIYNLRADRIIKAKVDELLLHDIGLWEKEVLSINPEHTTRQNYLEITLVD